MAQIKKFFPFSFGISDVTKLVINIVIYIVIAVVGGLILGLLSAIPVVGWLFVILGSLIDLYAFIGIVLAVLSFLKVV